MLKLNSKKAFTLAELMVVLAIIGILSAGAMNIFSGAIATARDSSRVTSLNVMKTALESYYVKHKIYPQPENQTSENVWGYVNKKAIATCGVSIDEKGNINGGISENECGGDIVIKEKKVESIKCNFDFVLNGDEDSDGSTKGNFELENDTELGEDDDVFKPLDGVYQFDDLGGVCENYVNKVMTLCENKDNGEDYECEIDNEIDDEEVNKMYFYYKNTSGEIGKVSKKSAKYNSSKIINKIIGWKGTLTEKSGERSIYGEGSKKLFEGFMQEPGTDPKYSSKKHKESGFGLYPYSVFRDGVGEKSEKTNSKTLVGGTAYQIAATFEKQDDDGNYHPETLIIGNYKRPKNSNGKIKKGYPRSLFGNGSDVILSGQKEGEKAKYVKKPNGTTNRGIPYPVEEIE